LKISKISDIFELENIGYISDIYIMPTLRVREFVFLRMVTMLGIHMPENGDRAGCETEK